jgi:hypothetical protein
MFDVASGGISFFLKTVSRAGAETYSIIRRFSRAVLILFNGVPTEVSDKGMRNPPKSYPEHSYSFVVPSSRSGEGSVLSDILSASLREHYEEVFPKNTYNREVRDPAYSAPHPFHPHRDPGSRLHLGDEHFQRMWAYREGCRGGAMNIAIQIDQGRGFARDLDTFLRKIGNIGKTGMGSG